MTGPQVRFIALLMLLALAIGWLAHDSERMCAPYESGRICVEVNPEGQNEAIYHP